MKWMIMVIVLGQWPTATNVMFDTLEKCRNAVDFFTHRFVYETAERARALGDKYKDSVEASNDELLLKNKMTCIPFEDRR